MTEWAFARQVSSIGRWLGLVAFAGLAACQTVPKRRTPPPPVVREAPPPPVTQGLPTDAERHRVALLVPLSGANAAVGTSISNAANLAVLQTGGKRIRVTMYDTGTGAASAAARAIAEGNRVILGPLLAEDVRVVAPVARANRVPLVSFSNDEAVAGQGVYLMGYSPEQAIDRVLGFARQRGATRIGALAPSGVYGQRASSAILRAVEDAGGRVAGMQSFDRSPGSVAAAAGRLARTGPFDAVVIADSSATAAQAVPLLRRGGVTSALILGPELWNTDPRIAAKTPLHGAYFASVSDTLYRQFATQYRARYGASPYRLASLGYDAVLLITKIAEDWPVGTPLQSRWLVDQDGFTGIDGAFRFGRDGVAERALEVQQIGPGGATVVSPAPRGFGR